MTWRSAMPFLVVLLSASGFTNCASNKGANSASGLGGSNCPDVTRVTTVEAFDFQAAFDLAPPGAQKIKSATIAAIDLKVVSDQIDVDLKNGCGGLASDLGSALEFKSGLEACQAAVKQMAEVKSKIGAKAQYTLDLKPPECGESTGLIAECASKCDGSYTPGKIECEPGRLSGTCGAQCSGVCDYKSSAKCDGECFGTCDAAMKGSCGGKCEGRCDGRSSKGDCNGTCEGKCDAPMSGTCKGQCGGSCKLKGATSCEGVCTGGCTAEFQEPRCTGKVALPKVNTECVAKCDGEANAHLECTPARVSLRIANAADTGAAAAYKQAIEKNLPPILKVSLGMGERAKMMADDVKNAVQSVQEGIPEIASAAGAAKAKGIGDNISACVGGPFKDALEASSILKVSVDGAINVQANVNSASTVGLSIPK